MCRCLKKINPQASNLNLLESRWGTVMSAGRFHGKRKTPVWRLSCKCHRMMSRSTCSWTLAVCGHMLGVPMGTISGTNKNMSQTKTLVLSKSFASISSGFAINRVSCYFTSGADRITREVKVEPGNPVTTLNIQSTEEETSSSHSDTLSIADSRDSEHVPV